MEANQASTTAQRVALRRALHQIVDDPVLFHDPLALRIVGSENAAALQADPRQFETSQLAPYIRISMAVRSRYAEDALAGSVREGVHQYVILGAGFDTFAYRNPHPGLRVFEVDHPETQALKRERLKEAGIVAPDSLTFVPVDFEQQTLADALAGSGYDTQEAAFFSWLGVVPYLTAEAATATLRFIASSRQGSRVVFDYLVPPETLTPAQRSRYDELARWVASVGEPWRSSFSPGKLGDDLREMGFGRVEDVSPDGLNARYCANRTDGLRVGSLSHLMDATV